MFDETWYPLGARAWYVLAIFAAALLLMHVVLVFWLRIGKLAWKRADYFWLGATVLSLVGAAAEVRRSIATADLRNRSERRDWAWKHVVDEVRFMTGPAVCSPFTKSEWSPPTFDDTQRQYDVVCQSAGKLLNALPSGTPESLPRTLSAIRPRISDPILSSFYAQVDDAARLFLREDGEYRKTRDAAERSEWDWVLVVTSPVLLALGLALRITKVTGEIRIEKSAAAAAVRGSAEQENSDEQPDALEDQPPASL